VVNHPPGTQGIKPGGRARSIFELVLNCWIGPSLLGDRCWELDALDPRELRSMLEQAIRAEIDWVEWNRCAEMEQAERESMRTMIDAWNDAP
jgi:hypothetical protein